MKIEVLKKELENKIMNFIELDNLMMNEGYYSVMNEGITEDIKRDETVVYTSVENGECEAWINFKIINDNGEDEIKESFELQIYEVYTM